jgi:CelD/BcsL family acetyltransferase involved in cellulose biosynthesis
MGAGISDYTGLLSRPSQLPEVAAAILRHLSAESPSWDALLLNDFPADDVAPVELARASREVGCRARVEEGESTLHLDLPGDHAAFRRNLSANLRRWLNRQRRLVEGELGGRLITLGDEQDLSPAMEHLFRLHCARQAALGRPQVLASENERRFHNQLAHRFRERGWLRLHFLVVEDEPVGALYGFLYRGVLYTYMNGFDVSMQQHSPGSIMLDHWVEKGIEEGAHKCDLLRGALGYKTRWAPQLSRSRNAVIVRHHTRHAIHQLLQNVRGRVRG